MWSSSAILALNETRIFIATVNVILTPAMSMSIYKAGSCRRVNIKQRGARWHNITHNAYWGDTGADNLNRSSLNHRTYKLFLSANNQRILFPGDWRIFNLVAPGELLYDRRP